jgi:hypothetical protein
VVPATWTKKLFTPSLDEPSDSNTARESTQLLKGFSKVLMKTPGREEEGGREGGWEGGREGGRERPVKRR